MTAHLWASGPAPSEYITTLLSREWGVPPAVVRAQPYKDVEATLVIKAVEARIARARARRQ